MRSFIVFLLISAACAAPVDKPASNDGTSTTASASDSPATSPPLKSSSQSVDESRSAAPINKQDEKRKRPGLRPLTGSRGGHYPSAIPYTIRPQPVPHFGIAPHLVHKPAPFIKPVPVSAPCIPAACPEPIKPAIPFPCLPQPVRKPDPIISEQVVHRPVVTEIQGIVRRPVYTEVIEIVHQPYYAEIQQAHKFPTHTLHIVRKPTYSVVKEESVSAPIHLPGEQYHVVAPPQYVKAPVVPVAPQQSYPFGTATCRAGDDCVIEKAVDGGDVLVIRRPLAAAAQPSYYYAASPYFGGIGRSNDAADGSYDDGGVYADADVEDWNAAIASEGGDEVADSSSVTDPVDQDSSVTDLVDQNARKITKMLARSLASDESFVQKIYSTMDSISAELQRQQEKSSTVEEWHPAKSDQELTNMVNSMSDEDRTILRKILEARSGRKDAFMAKSNDKNASSS